MPTYSYTCACGAQRDLIARMKDHTPTIPCECGQQMRQRLTGGHRVIPDIEPYRSMITGERIRGRAHHREHLRQHGCIEIGNERQETQPKPLPPVAPDIKRAIEQLRSR